MRVALVFVLLLLGACEGGFVRAGDLGRKVRIEKSYEARDACLARNSAADSASAGDTNAIAHVVAEACAPETERLVQASNSDGDARVAAYIRRDTEYRAKKYVLRARGQSGY